MLLTEVGARFAGAVDQWWARAVEDPDLDDDLRDEARDALLDLGETVLGDALRVAGPADRNVGAYEASALRAAGASAVPVGAGWPPPEMPDGASAWLLPLATHVHAIWGGLDAEARGDSVDWSQAPRVLAAVAWLLDARRVDDARVLEVLTAVQALLEPG